MELIEKFYINNGKLEEIDTFDDSILNSDCIIYEVIRVVKGIPLFFEQHMERLVSSTKAYDIEITDVFYKQLEADVFMLIKANDFPLKNIKILLILNEGNIHYYLYFIQSKYPTFEMYSSGVNIISASAERHNPKIKQVNHDLKKQIAILLEESNAYEAILIDKDGYVTEGSRSNLFFINEGTVYTSLPERVLSGITRTNIIKVCEDMHIPVVEKLFFLDEMQKAEAVFLCGTSPKILPISSIDGYPLANANSHLLYSIMIEYTHLMEAYIEEKLKESL